MPRPRFTLRVMLIIVAATAGWLGMKVYRAEQQKREHSRAPPVLKSESRSDGKLRLTARASAIFKPR